jgi:methionine sulfoxide reductase catalytic subunit
MAVERIPARDVTPESVYANRRAFLKFGVAAASVGATALGYRLLNRTGATAVTTDMIPDVAPATGAFRTDEAMTPLDRVTNYNNFYEFSTDKESVAAAAASFQPKPWQIDIGGMVHNPRRLDIDDLFKIAKPEERIYRMRCVEAWSIVVPWVGIPLKAIIDSAMPMGSAKYVAFETLHDPVRFPGQKSDVLTWPYVEGLRLDEAMHPLTILAVGLYGRLMPPQNGAPVRLIVPWKYGFKGIKSIVRITLSEAEPPATWHRDAPGEYGFYANVNPDVPHPRWSQATEQRLGESGRRPTLPFNGYADQVAHLYQGMDLRANY